MNLPFTIPRFWILDGTQSTLTSEPIYWSEIGRKVCELAIFCWNVNEIWKSIAIGVFSKMELKSSQ